MKLQGKGHKKCYPSWDSNLPSSYKYSYPIHELHTHCRYYCTEVTVAVAGIMTADSCSGRYFCTEVLWCICSANLRWHCISWHCISTEVGTDKHQSIIFINDPRKHPEQKSPVLMGLIRQMFFNDRSSSCISRNRGTLSHTHIGSIKNILLLHNNFGEGYACESDDTKKMESVVFYIGCTKHSQKHL